MRTLSWHYSETGDHVCTQDVRNAECEEPNCPLCGKLTVYWEGTVDQDRQGNDIDACNYAERIRFEDRCAISGCKGLMLSYQTPHDDRPRREDRETCGYWCSRCDFGNAGSRPIRQPKFNRATKAG